MADARALYKEGFQHFAGGRLEEAIGCYRRALDADPRLAIAWNGLSMALQRSGQIDAAIEAAQRLIELEPDDPLSHTNLSILYQNKGLIQEAEDEMAVATRLQARQEGEGGSEGCSRPTCRRPSTSTWWPTPRRRTPSSAS